MHTSTHYGVTFIHNGDCSGDVEIRSSLDSITVPFDALLSFVADHVRRQKIAALEDASDEKILGIKGKS